MAKNDGFVIQDADGDVIAVEHSRGETTISVQEKVQGGTVVAAVILTESQSRVFAERLAGLLPPETA